jgi:hypothetical protein
MATKVTINLTKGKQTKRYQQYNVAEEHAGTFVGSLYVPLDPQNPEELAIQFVGTQPPAQNGK